MQAVKAAEDAAVQATQAAQQAEAGGSPVDVVAKATLATVRCSQVRTSQPGFIPCRSGLFCACSLCSRAAGCSMLRAELAELQGLLRQQVAT